MILKRIQCILFFSVNLYAVGFSFSLNLQTKKVVDSVPSTKILPSQDIPEISLMQSLRSYLPWSKNSSSEVSKVREPSTENNNMPDLNRLTQRLKESENNYNTQMNLQKKGLLRTSENVDPLDNNRTKPILTMDKWGNLYKDGYLDLPLELASRSLLYQARRMFLYSQASRCDFPSEKWECGPFCEDQKYGVNNTVFIGKFQHDKTKMRGIVAVDRSRQEIIVGFRATERGSDYFYFNLRIWGTPQDSWDFSKGNGPRLSISIHSGYNYAYKVIQKEFLKLLKIARNQYPNFKVIFTGHSMGGAIAAIAACDVILGQDLNKQQVALFTYGAPPVGSLEFKNFLNEYESYSFVNLGDWITVVPSFKPASYFWKSLYTVGKKILITRMDHRYPDHSFICENEWDCNNVYENKWLKMRCSFSHYQYFNIVSGTEYCEARNEFELCVNTKIMALPAPKPLQISQFVQDIKNGEMIPSQYDVMNRSQYEEMIPSPYRV